MTILMSFESILSHLPDDPHKSINALIKHYHSLQSWQGYYTDKHQDAAMLAHITTTLGQVARELAARLLDTYPPGERVTGDDIETWTALERIAE